MTKKKLLKWCLLVVVGFYVVPTAIHLLATEIAPEHSAENFVNGKVNSIGYCGE